MSIKPVITKELFIPAEDCEFSLDYERKNKLVCLVIKYMYNAFGNLIQKKRSVLPPPPPFFSDGRLLEASILPKIVQKIKIFSVQIGGWAFI